LRELLTSALRALGPFRGGVAFRSLSRRDVDNRLGELVEVPRALGGHWSRPLRGNFRSASKLSAALWSKTAARCLAFSSGHTSTVDSVPFGAIRTTCHPKALASYRSRFILGICAPSRPFSSPKPPRHNQTDPLPARALRWTAHSCGCRRAGSVAIDIRKFSAKPPNEPADGSRCPDRTGAPRLARQRAHTGCRKKEAIPEKLRPDSAIAGVTAQGRRGPAKRRNKCGSDHVMLSRSRIYRRRDSLRINSSI
jgi:hypothetical protein